MIFHLATFSKKIVTLGFCFVIASCSSKTAGPSATAETPEPTLAQGAIEPPVGSKVNKKQQKSVDGLMDQIPDDARDDEVSLPVNSYMSAGEKPRSTLEQRRRDFSTQRTDSELI